jgi:uncharacterized PurR-regulated membrane protein YhhQ (DUF165 family)
MTTVIAIVLYAAAMLSANFLVFAFGPWISPINSFFLIGLDLALRDWLHVRLRPSQMAALIACTGAITWVLNPAAGGIAIASSVAFTLAALVDWSVFYALAGSWRRRANLSNVAGAAVDSLVFPTIAFGALLPHIVAMQFAAKISGGFVWTYIIERFLHKK